MAAKKNNDVTELLELVKELWPNSDIKKNDLQNPDSNFVFNFYKMCLESLDQFVTDITGFEKININIESKEIDPVLLLYKELKNLMNLLEIKYFALIDIYKPPPRTKTTLKIVLTFLCFLKNEITVCKEIYMKQMEPIEVSNDLRDAIYMLTIKERNMLIEKGRNADMLPQLLEEFKKKKVCYREMLEIKEAKQLEWNEKCHKLKEMENNRDQKKVAYDNYSKETELLAAQVIPDEEFDQLQNACKELEVSLKIKEQEYNDLAAQLEIKHASLKKYEALMQEVNLLSNEYLHVIVKIKQQEIELISLEGQRKTLIIKENKRLLQQMNDDLEQNKTIINNITKQKNNLMDLLESEAASVNNKISTTLKLEEEYKNYIILLSDQFETVKKECVLLQKNINNVNVLHYTEYEKILESEQIVYKCLEHVLEEIEKIM